MTSKYDQAKEDMEALEELVELNDWVSIEDDLALLMADPTKKRAWYMYESAIDLWFSEHGVIDGSEEIAERRGYL